MLANSRSRTQERAQISVICMRRWHASRANHRDQGHVERRGRSDTPLLDGAMNAMGDRQIPTPSALMGETGSIVSCVAADKAGRMG